MKKNIPKVVKDLCWKKWVGEHVSKTKCFCCEMNDVTMNQFHCGHVQAEAEGGSLSVENLRPICAGCNLSMGKENLFDFKKRCGFGRSENRRERSEDQIFYKKFDSFADIEKLNCIVPDIQRDIIPEHVEEIRSYIQRMHEKGKEPILSTLDIAKWGTKYFLCDGQHRFVALQQFFRQGFKIPIHCMIYEVNSQEEIADIFLTKNQNCPLPSYLTQEQSSKQSSLGLKELQAYLVSRYTVVFKHSKTSRPYIYINDFMDQFAELIKEKEISSFVSYFEELNQACYLRLKDLNRRPEEKRKLGISDRMMNFWDEHGIYVGYKTTGPNTLLDL